MPAARGSVPLFTFNHLRDLEVPSDSSRTVEMCLEVLRDSIRILNIPLHHSSVHQISSRQVPNLGLFQSQLVLIVSPPTTKLISHTQTDLESWTK